jgi:pyruvate dehydrogenase E2 component (dihydrolipoyllysine-residue acetyltransferase)
VMPRLSDTMEEGTVLRWLKHDGEQVARGEELVEIETDKAAMTYESDEQGTLEIVAAEGETLPVGATIARIGGPVSETAPKSQATPAPPGTPPAHEHSASPARDQPSTAGAEQSAGASAMGEAPSSSPQPAVRVKASPLARRIAAERGIDLGGIAGSGPGGRVVKADVEAAEPSDTQIAGARTPAAGDEAPAESAGRPTDSATAQSPPPAPPQTLAERVAGAKGETTVIELTRTQQTIARRMAESKATIPDFELQAEIDMEACVALRGELKRLSAGEAPTYNDMVVKACALALREHPRANGSYRDGRLQLHSRVNVGVAVATDDALVVPTIFDADRKSLGEIARETRSVAERVRAGTVTPPELGGGTFTVSNLGMYGVRSFTAIVNPPQICILSVGSLELRAVVRDGEVVARNTMIVTLASDHRVLYGADAARLLARIRDLLQRPTALTL